MSTSAKMPGNLVISLDFELMWGMFDKVSHETYGDNLDGVATAIPRMLELFSKYDIHATWAVVGMLLAKNETDLRSYFPMTHKSSYEQASFSSYAHAVHNPTLTRFPHHYFAPELVTKIIETPYQELASHTFSHLYCRETFVGGEGGLVTAFTADCNAFTKIAATFKVTPVSMVFPRNQWSQTALRILETNGFRSYRGTENHFIYRARSEASQTNTFIRSLRLLDHYINISGYHTYPKPTPASLQNLPASRFLRPYNQYLFFLETLRLRRIKRAMTHAAKHGEIFHLWWHPHNFGVNQTKNFRMLEKILRHYQYLNRTYGMISSTMREVATHEIESNELHISVG